MENINEATQNELTPSTKLGERLVRWGERLDNWCDQETSLTHKDVRIGLALLAGIGAGLSVGLIDRGVFNTPSGASLKDALGKWQTGELFQDGVPIRDIMRQIVIRGSATLSDESQLYNLQRWTVSAGPEDRLALLDNLIGEEKRLVAKDLSGKIILFAGMGLSALNTLFGSEEEVKMGGDPTKFVASAISYIGKIL